ncbi:hypothetical protein HY772_09030 [Candidatus Woesearchaeota archaeon]|nr:hypothetical protein [Candidatus Woesearchaeota archaeon]
MTRICIFGDSITWGAYDPDQGGWVGRLRKHFESRRVDAEIYNCGINGDNTFSLLKRFEAESKAREPDVIMFAIGINDSQYVNSKDNPRVSLQDYNRNLQKLLALAKKQAKVVIFVGLTCVDEAITAPIPWNPIKYYENERIRQYDAVLESFCTENGLLYIPMFDLLKKNDFYDGLHPNSQGHQKISERASVFLMKSVVAASQ